jgi:NAD(P)H-dependent flavin oxidoreductase YrpB (nitropropane dioxygenase family)
MLRTRVCDLLGIRFPIISAPLGPTIAGPELAAAVSRAGGLGVMSWGARPPELLRQAIRRVRELAPTPFGVNVIVPFGQDDQITVCLEERVPVLSLSFGEAPAWIERARAAGVRVVRQVGSVAEARRAARAGVDLVIAQGVEAGGHLAGAVATTVLVPRVVDAVAPTPVAAAGGIADARGVVAALALGAEAVVLGTRFLATPEAAAHPDYKARVVAAGEEDTVNTMLFGGGWPGTPHRALRTPFVETWREHEERGQEQRADEPVVGETTFAGRRIPVQRFASLPPVVETTGDIESMALLMGQSAGLVHGIEPAAEIVSRLVEDARRIVARLAALSA